ncbi:MAG: HEAT repeat domain-containing protein [Deltaproteobacteria bacterium]|nr:HEAT repeat domain-containing protein [Deltaproteobacteria bacterium]
MSQGLATLLQNLFKIRPEEAPRTGMAFLYLFAAIGAFIVGRIARTVLFLEIPNYKEQLPLMYVLIAITVSIIMYAYTRVERRLRRDITNSITLVALTLGTLAFRFALHGGEHLVYWVFYIWIEILGGFLVVQFWTLTNEIFNARQAKRLFAIIGGGGVIANIVFGFAISNTVKSLGTENLLYVLCACLAVCLAMTVLLGRNARPELMAARDRKLPPGRQKAPLPQKIFASRHVIFIAGVVILTYLVSTLADYQFQVIIGDFIPGKDERSAFFGTFFGVTGILGGLVQFFVTARLLERFGVLVSLVLLPLAMLTGSIGILSVPLVSALWASSFTKGSENVLRYTVNDTTLQLLYLPLHSQVRSRAKTVIDGIFKPLSIGIAGVTLALLVGQLDKLAGISLGFTVDVYQLSWVVAAALLGWIGILLGLRREYIQSLLSTLQRRRLNLAEANFQIADTGTVQVLDRALGATKVGEVLHALELLPHVSAKIRGPLDARTAFLLLHEAEEIRVAALDYLGSTGTLLHHEEVRVLLTDASSEVRASATLALCAMRHGDALGDIQPMLQDPDGKVRACAVAGLIRHGGLDGVLACADQLKRMLSSPNPADRERAAWILGEVGVQNFYQPLVPLFADSSEQVRHAAIVAAGRLKTQTLVKPLVDQLSHPRLATVAVASLSSLGPAILDVAIELLKDSARPARQRAQAPRIMARILDGRCIEILTQHLEDGEEQVRSAAVAALATLCNRMPGARLDMNAVAAAIRKESQAYFNLLALDADLDLGDAVPLLADAIRHRQGQVQARLFGLLGLKYPADTIDQVVRSLLSSQATTRANATEVLDNLLANEEKPYVIPLVEDTPIAQKLKTATATFSIPRHGRAERLEELLRSHDEWLQVCAAVAVAAWKLTALEPLVRDLLVAENPVCRETAVHVLKNLGSAAYLRVQGPSLIEDPSPSVSRYARFVLEGLA